MLSVMRNPFFWSDNARKIVNMGIEPSQFREMEERVAKNRRARPAPIPNPVPVLPPVLETRPTRLLDWVMPDMFGHQFTYWGKPIGKPTMTYVDRWKKRRCVVEYRAFADKIREAAGVLPPNPDGVIVKAHIPMPPSWSKKKKAAMAGKPCRQKPDYDNIAKAVGDTLFEEDRCLWFGAVIKHWCAEGSERLEVEVLYARSK
jgi:Holliday junction resolvase RusA-like endonuclease